MDGMKDELRDVRTGGQERRISVGFVLVMKYCIENFVLLSSRRNLTENVFYTRIPLTIQLLKATWPSEELCMVVVDQTVTMCSPSAS